MLFVIFLSGKPTCQTVSTANIIISLKSGFFGSIFSDNNNHNKHVIDLLSIGGIKVRLFFNKYAFFSSGYK